MVGITQICGLWIIFFKLKNKILNSDLIRHITPVSISWAFLIIFPLNLIKFTHLPVMIRTKIWYKWIQYGTNDEKCKQMIIDLRTHTAFVRSTSLHSKPNILMFSYHKYTYLLKIIQWNLINYLNIGSKLHSFDHLLFLFVCVCGCVFFFWFHSLGVVRALRLWLITHSGFAMFGRKCLTMVVSLQNSVLPLISRLDLDKFKHI